MRLARLATPGGPRYAVADGDLWHLVEDAVDLRPTGAVVTAGDARLLAPCEPRVVVGMAHNHRRPDGARRPPQAFMKSSRSVVGPGDPIVVEPLLGTVQVEAELAAVLRRPARNLTLAEAADAVAGFTIGNDVTAVDQIGQDELLTQAKHGDGFTPLGPWVETSLDDPDDVVLRVVVDGAEVARASTAELVDGLLRQLVYVTRYLTLGPGDVVLGGCPGTAAPVRPGQHVRLEAAGIGGLENPVVAPTR